MVDGILDLIVPPKEAELVTRRVGDAAALGKELIFLGPDENITPRDLDWIVQRAATRGYSMPSAFMSSKPRAGINHKEYGVTSEGVAVFLGEALRAIGIRPAEEPWTIKLTVGQMATWLGTCSKSCTVTTAPTCASLAWLTARPLQRTRTAFRWGSCSGSLTRPSPFRRSIRAN